MKVANEQTMSNGVRSMPWLATFKSLALGTRFKYLDTVKTWVKLSNDGTVAEWDGGNIDTHWIGQSICCFNDDDNFDEKVIIVG